MEFKQVSQNGIVPQTPLRTRQSKLGLMISTTSTIDGQPVVLRAVSDASINKFEPAYFYNYRLVGSSATYTLLGTSTWVANNATFVTTDLSTGTNNIYCVWPGEGPFAPQSTWPNVGTIFVSEGAALDGITTLNAYPGTGQVVAYEGPVTFVASYFTSIPLVGTVQFYADNVLVGVSAIVDNQAQYTVNALPAGVIKIKAVLPSFTYNSVIYKATVSELDYEVLRGTIIAQNMTLTFPNGPDISYEDDVTLKATITGTNDLPGLVKFYNGVQNIGYAGFIGDSAQVDIANNLAPGTYSITASWDGNQSGSPKYIEKVTTATLTILERNTVDSFVLTASTYEDVEDTNYPVLYATATGSKPVNGFVNFVSSGLTIGQAPLVNNVATFTATNLTVGTYYLSAQYLGNASAPKYYPANSNVITFNVVANFTSTMTLSGTPNPVYQLNTGTFNVTNISTLTNTYTGIVTVKDISYTDTIATTATFAATTQTVYYDIEDYAFVGTETYLTFVNVSGLSINQDVEFVYPDLVAAPWLNSYEGPRGRGFYKVGSINTATKTVRFLGPNLGTDDIIYDSLEYWYNLYPSGISTSTYQSTIYPGFKITPGVASTSTISVRTIISEEILALGTWTNTNTLALVYDPNDVEKNSDVSHYIQASWPGQDVGVGQLPFAPVSSNLFNLDVTRATMDIIEVNPLAAMTIADPLTVRARITNTSTVTEPYNVKIKNGAFTLAEEPITGINTDITFDPGTFSSGTTSLTCQLPNTYPLVESSNTLAIQVNERAVYPGTVSLQGPSSIYQLNNAVFTATLSLNTATTGSITLSGFVAGLASTSTTATNTSVYSIRSVSTSSTFAGTTSSQYTTANTQTSTATLTNSTVTTSVTIVSTPSNKVITTVTNTLVVQTTTVTSITSVTNYIPSDSAEYVLVVNQDPEPYMSGSIMLNIPTPIPAGWRDPTYFQGYASIDGKTAKITSYNTSSFQIYYDGYLGDYPYVQNQRYLVTFSSYWEKKTTTSTQVTTSTSINKVTTYSTLSYKPPIVPEPIAPLDANRTAVLNLSAKSLGVTPAKILAGWSGQAWNPSQGYYPYYGADSELKSVTILPATMTMTLKNPENNGFAQVPVVVTLNSTVNTATQVTFYKNGDVIGTVPVVNSGTVSTATFFLSTGSIATNNNTIKAEVTGTNPVVSVSTITQALPSFPAGYTTTTMHLFKFDVGVQDSAQLYWYDEVTQKNQFYHTKPAATVIDLVAGKFGPGLGISSTATMALNDSWYFPTVGQQQRIELGRGDYTSEFWAYLDTGLNNFNLFGGGTGTINFNSSYMQVVVPGTSTSVTTTVPITEFYGKWTHIALVRYDGIFRIYLDGIKRYEQANNYYIFATFNVGFNGNQNNVWNKLIVDDFRISQGARYINNFLPPTTPLQV